ncbi:MAG: VWA domain-containing protein [Acidobacteria bacterium]|nr:VWA domain-containing protein [Acidobacteriota bacterium]
MKKDLAPVLALLLVLTQAPPAAWARRQQQQPAPPAPAAAEDTDDDDVVRVTSNLIQFDAVVLDKQGRLVTDLRPEDFEVTVGGRRQEVTHLSFVSNETGTVTQLSAAPRDKGAPPAPPARLTAAQVRRTIALVVDDLGTSFESLIHVRRALRKFVDEQMRPGDLVAVIQTGRGTGALQQFTGDKQLLYRAIERVQWNPLSRLGVSAIEAINESPMEQFKGDLPSAKKKEEEEKEGIVGEPGVEQLREEVFTIGTLGALNFVIRGMKGLPGRKSIIHFGDGLPIFDRTDLVKSNRLREKVRQLAELANRASIVINTMDTRGLPYTGVTAADHIEPGRDDNKIAGIMAGRTASYADSQEGLRFLAEETGGVFVHDNNDLGGGVEHIVGARKGYYLIAFRPDETVFERVRGGARFNSIEVKVKRAGLRVRTRAGFYGITDQEAAAAPKSRTQQILSALASPLSAGDLPLRMTSLFSSTAAKQATVDSLVHIDVSRLKFTDEPDGWKKAVIDVVALTFGEDERIIDEVNRTETLRARAETYEDILKNGVVYLMKVPVNKPGAYQLRVVVRDTATARIGSASQFIEVPDITKDRLALSGIFVTAAAPAALKASAAAAAAATSGEADPLRNATLRRFRHGSQVDFSYHIYNARAGGGTGAPRLRTQVRLFRDGRVVFEGPAQAYAPARTANVSRLPGGGRLQLGGSLQPGEYSLQVVVTDELASGKSRTAAQWIDFEIVK